MLEKENWQTRSVDFAQKHNLTHTVGVNVLDLVSEVGEVANEMLLLTDYGGQEMPAASADLALELGDVLFSPCLLAGAAGVDLDQAFARALLKYEQRRREQGDIGSRPA